MVVQQEENSPFLPRTCEIQAVFRAAYGGQVRLLYGSSAPQRLFGAQRHKSSHKTSTGEGNDHTSRQTCVTKDVHKIATKNIAPCHRHCPVMVKYMYLAVEWIKMNDYMKCFIKANWTDHYTFLVILIVDLTWHPYHIITYHLASLVFFNINFKKSQTETSQTLISIPFLINPSLGVTKRQIV